MNNNRSDVYAGGIGGSPNDNQSSGKQREGEELTSARSGVPDEIQRMLLSAQQELELARRVRAQAEKYSRETEAKARSQAQLLIIQARMAIKKEITELKNKVGEEIQEVLRDMRLFRIAAQEELEAQRKFTSAARLRILSMASGEVAEERVDSGKELVNT